MSDQWTTFLKDLVVGLLLCLPLGLLNNLKWLIPSLFSKSVENQVVLITGAGSGMGRLLAEKMADLRAVIICVDVNEDANETTVKRIRGAGGKAHALTCDMSDGAAIAALAKRVEREFGGVDILVNNAGIVSGANLVDAPEKKIELTFRVNSLAPILTTRSFLPSMTKRKKGHIVTMASMAGVCGAEKLVDYCASKFAAVGFDESLRAELWKQGHSPYIKTTLICPYYVSTGMFEGVNSPVIPVLTPEYVVNCSLDAILTEREWICLPWWLQYVAALKFLVPPKAALVLMRALGQNQAMENFVGRKK